ncbi:MAG: hypothetical protein NTX38_12555 [Methylobacter sp.]|nr:hypothetical protein [Methylobacter sp.]
MKSIYKAIIFIGFNSLLINTTLAETKSHTPEGEQSQIRAAVNHVLKANHYQVERHKSSYFAALIKGQEPKAIVVTCSVQGFIRTQ